MKSQRQHTGLKGIPIGWLLLLASTGVLNAQSPADGLQGSVPWAEFPAGEGNPPQAFREYIRNAQGTDQELMNGKQFYFKYLHIQRHPYFFQETSMPGRVSLNGRIYTGLRLNYDIYEQFVILEYSPPSGGINKIILNSVSLDAFTLGDYSFEKLNLDERGPLFYQVIRTGNLACYVHWQKYLTGVQNNLRYYGSFTNPARDYWIDSGDGLRTFRRRRSFVALLPDSARKEIGGYLRNHGIRFRNADPAELTRLIGFTSDVLKKTVEN